MQYSPIIAAAGRDADTVRRAGLQCLHLCTALSENGSFTVLQHPVCVRGDLLGIADRGSKVRSPSSFAASAVSLAQSRGCDGILADFQRRALAETVSALDENCHRCGLSFWIPVELIEHAPHAICIAETAISGGSLTKRFSSLCEKYGSNRVAAQLIRACARFSIPSSTPDGEPMDFDQAESFRRQMGAVPFFSRELCAKYYTCTLDGTARFVLFDDAETLRAKQAALRAIGVTRQLVVYPDAELLGLIGKDR